jgi:hypothetical protein
MWGDNIRTWFELFSGMTVHRVGGPLSEGWLNVDDIEGRFRREGITFNGSKYDSSNGEQKNALEGAIIGNAGSLCYVRLLERRRQLNPPSLDYRVTRLGRTVDGWGYGDKPGARKRLFFLLIEILLRLLKYKWIVAFGAAGWATLNAIRFYGAAWEWLSHDIFAIVSAIVIGLLLWLVSLVAH